MVQDRQEQSVPNLLPIEMSGWSTGGFAPHT
jgi:hypothetical protein